MQIRKRHVHWVGKEVVRCQVDDISCEVPCYYDPTRKAFIAVLGPHGFKSGRPWLLTGPQVTQVEKILVEALGVKRFLGLAIGRREVYVQREHHVS